MVLAKNRPLVYWLVVFLYAGFIFYLSSIPELPSTLSLPFLDKGFHFLEYLLLGILLFRAIINTSRLKEFQIFLLVITIGTLYAMSDEVHQIFVVGRDFSIGDLFADSFGIMSAKFFFR